MKVEILPLLEGARRARGLTVIIDVFRAFTVEAYLLDQGMEKILTVGKLDDAYRLKEEYPDYILIGERNGKILPGFAYGNSPSAIKGVDFNGCTAIHTTSAGTQGIVAAEHAEEILGGSLVTADALAAYILRKQPDIVSLVPMGKDGIRSTEEDVLCAEYIASLLEKQQLPDYAERLYDLRFQEGRKFFDPAQQEVFPEADFHLCVKTGIFPFIVRLDMQNGIFTARKENVL